MQKILIGNETSLAVADALGKGTYTIVPLLVTDFKAIKNRRNSKVSERATFMMLLWLDDFSWLEEQLNKGVEINESQESDQLAKFRLLR